RHGEGERLRSDHVPARSSGLAARRADAVLVLDLTLERFDAFLERIVIVAVGVQTEPLLEDLDALLEVARRAASARARSLRGAELSELLQRARELLAVDG